MSNKLIDTKTMTQEVNNNTAKMFQDNIKIDGRRITLCFCFNPDSTSSSLSYFKALEKMGRENGIEVMSIELPKNYELSKSIIELINKERGIDFILLDKPSPYDLDKYIDDKKDIEGCNNNNYIKTIKNKNSDLKSSTTMAVEYILDGLNQSLENKDVLIVGRSNNVGKQIGMMMLNKYDCNITFTHSKTDFENRDLKKYDIVITASSMPTMFTFDSFREDAIVLDLGYFVYKNQVVGNVTQHGKIGHYNEIKNGISSLATALLLNKVMKRKMEALNGRRISFSDRL